MINCTRCNGRMFIDRQYTEVNNLELYCIICGSRKFFHPPSNSQEGKCLLKREQLRAKATMSSL